MARSPYENLPKMAFWRNAVAEQHPLSVQGLYTKKFAIPPHARIATAGSCFAQHIARHMRDRGYKTLDLEPPPPGLSPEQARRFGYTLYSARYGNIYLARQLLQLAKEARGRFEPADAVWERDGRYFDALRPSVEPEGLASPEEVRAHRADHLARVRKLFRHMDIFIFTLGLTEGWVHKESGTVYPTAPGTIAGSYDQQIHEFKNFQVDEILKDLIEFRHLVHRNNPTVKFLFTVSPVPLTATASGQNCLTATTYSKSVLRAVAGQMYGMFEDVDYFPSYELIATPFSRGFFYEPNLRSVEQGGVEAVMRVFFQEHGLEARPKVARAARARQQRKASAADEVVCEEELLNAFNR